MISDAELQHNARVNQLYHTLHSKDWYISVEREVPYYKTNRLEQILGEADIVTLDEDKLVYWEVKTGNPSKALRKIKQQYRRWFQSKKRTTDLKPYFVSYNPRNEARPVIGKFRRYHANE